MAVIGDGAMTDLFGLEQQPKRSNDRRESAALVQAKAGELTPRTPLQSIGCRGGVSSINASAINQLAPFDRLKKYQCLSNEGIDHAKERQSQD